MGCVCNLRVGEVEAGGSHLSGLSVQTDIQSRLNGELCHTCTHKRQTDTGGVTLKVVL